MSATVQINRAFREAAHSRSPAGTAYTGKEIKAGVAAAKSDDGFIDDREKNLISYNLSYRGNGFGEGGRDEFYKAYRELALPRDPVTDRDWMKQHGNEQ